MSRTRGPVPTIYLITNDYDVGTKPTGQAVFCPKEHMLFNRAIDKLTYPLSPALQGDEG